jgi:LPXTG-site transpeptidase (sortase) family protein
MRPARPLLLILLVALLAACSAEVTPSDPGTATAPAPATAPTPVPAPEASRAAPDPGPAPDSRSDEPRLEVAAERGSARLADLATASRPAPATLRVPEIGVDAPVLGVGADEAGDLEVIDDVENVGWYRYGPVPGEPGSAVLAAHVDTAADGPGVFFDLGRLAVGDRVEVELEDGSTATFVVDGVERHAKADLPVDTLFSREGEARLTLITCGGEFDSTRRSYSDNVVVTAAAVEG